MVIPAWVSIDKVGLAKVEASVRQGETMTMGEIVPMVVRRSSVVSHVPFTLALLLAFCFLPFGRLLNLNIPIWVQGFAEVFGAIILSLILSRLDWVQRLFISDSDKSKQVHQRALVEFYLNGLNKTSGGTGVLIFLSQMERQAVVLADETISKKLDEKVWDEVMSQMIDKIKTSGLAHGISFGVLHCAEILAKYFPGNGPRPDELKNELQIKD